MKMRMASALTNPVMTERETKRITLPDLCHAGHDLQDTGQQGGGEQILQPVIPHQRDHEQRHGPGGRGNHPGSPADKRGNDGNAKRGVEADLRVDPGDDGEGDRFRNERQRHHQSGKHVAPDVAEPLLLQVLPVNCHEPCVSKSRSCVTVRVRSRRELCRRTAAGRRTAKLPDQSGASDPAGPRLSTNHPRHASDDSTGSNNV